MARSRDVAMVTDLWCVLTKIDTHTVFIVSTSIRQLLGGSQRRWFLCVWWEFSELWSSNLWDRVAHLLGLGGWVKIRTFAFVVYTGVSRLMSTKLSANIEHVVSFIIFYWNCDGLLKGRCYGNWFVAHVGEIWHTPSSFCALAFNIRCEYRNANCCLNIDEDSSTSDKNCVKFGP